MTTATASLMNTTSSADILRLQTQTEDLDATHTITELQIGLQNTIALANDIKAENVDLKKQLDSANAFSKANLQRHSDWKEAWKKEREVVSMREKQLEQNEMKWKARLEDSRNELKELERKKLLLNSECSIDGVSLDLLKDVHAEHDSKVQRLTEEVRSLLCILSTYSLSNTSPEHRQTSGGTNSTTRER